jgi:hypothetical protein
MNEHTQTASEWKRDEAMKRNFAVVTGYVLSALTVAILLADAGVTLFIPTQFQAEMNAAGFPMTLAPSLGAIEVFGRHPLRGAPYRGSGRNPDSWLLRRRDLRSFPPRRDGLAPRTRLCRYRDHRLGRPVVS